MIRKLLLIAALVTTAGCTPYRYERPAPGTATDTVITPTRTRRGNPPFYEVMGQRYYVATTSDGYRETGVASWYGKQFHGLPTASGEIYDMYELTAAHKTLPVPTWVEVTNLSNDASIIVKVNDRGPFVDNRIIDLSFAAAQQLGMVEAGTSLVEVRALGTPSTGTDQTTARAADPISSDAVAPAGYATPTRTSEPLFLQVGAFGDPANARRLLDRLTGEGFEDVFMISATQSTPAIHRIRIGPIESVASFDALIARLTSLGFADARLVMPD